MVKVGGKSLMSLETFKAKDLRGNMESYGKPQERRKEKVEKYKYKILFI